jgi:tetratricopeptide (TPR) repeat protein
MEHRAWSLLDKTPEKHINEPVLASYLVSPKGDAKHHLMMVAVGGVIKGIVPGEGVGAELVKMGLEHGAEAAADKLREHKEEKEGIVALTPHMYLVMGASKFGLYAVTQRSLLYFIQGELVLVPHAQVAALTLGQTHLTTLDLTLQLRNGLTLELECGRGGHEQLEQMQAILRRVNPAQPSAPLPLPGYGMLPSSPPAPASVPPKTKEQWVQEGRAAARAGRFQEALAAYEAAIALDPNLGYAHFGRGEALRVLNRLEEALLAFERAIQLSPQDAAPYRHKGYVLNALKRSSEAFSALEYAIRLDPAQAGAYVGIGEALQGIQRPADALAAYDRALALDPRLGDAVIGKGAVLSTLGQYPQALEVYELALSLDPGNAPAIAGKQEVQKRLAQSESLASGQSSAPDLAAQFAQRSVAISGNLSQALDATERVSRPLPGGP